MLRFNKGVTLRSTWRQCFTCSNCVHLRCTFLPSSEFDSLSCSHSWSCSSCFISASSRGCQSANTKLFSPRPSSKNYSTVHNNHSTNSPPMHFFLLILNYKPLVFLLSCHYNPSSVFCSTFFISGSTSTSPASSSFPDSLRIVQWNADDLRARSVELLHSASLFSVNFICIQQSNLTFPHLFGSPWILSYAIGLHPLPVLLSFIW